MAKKKGKLKQVEEGSKRVEIGQYDITVAPSETFGGQTRSQQRGRRATTGDQRFDKGFAAAYLATRAALGRATIPPVPDLIQDYFLFSPAGGAGLAWTTSGGGILTVPTHPDLLGLTALDGNLVWVQNERMFYQRNQRPRTGTNTDWDRVSALDPPTTNTGWLQNLVYDPLLPAQQRIAWQDDRDRFRTVQDLNALVNMPLQHLNLGKLAYVRTTGLIYEYVASPATHTATIADWQALGTGSVGIVGRMAGLPRTGVRNGAPYLVKQTVAGVTMDRLVIRDNSVPMWRRVNQVTYTKNLRVNPDQPTDLMAGDLQVTIEQGHKELKEYDQYSGWVEIFSEDRVKGWIAALSLFQGTVQEVGGTHAGAIPLNNMPPLTLDKVAHYWTWIGTPSYVVQPTDPDIGADLAGAILNPGDWLQIANRGTPAVPDLHWVQVGGDLLAKSRGDLLYGMQRWVPGGWEAGAVVAHEEKLYRATVAVLPTDPTPGTVTRFSITGNVTATGEIDTQADLDQLIADYAVDATNRGRWWVVSAAGEAAGVRYQGSSLQQGWAILNMGDPRFGINNTGWTFSRPPWPQSVPTEGTAPNKWAEINLGGSPIRTVQTDQNLPATGSFGQFYLVLDSARQGHQTGFYTWDVGAQLWRSVGGSSSTSQLRNLTGRKLINVGTPIGSIIAFGGTTLPDGYLWCNGAAFDGTTYAELATVLGRAATPDLRSKFIRAGDPAETDPTARTYIDPTFPAYPGTTAAPTIPFTTDDPGSHNHEYYSGYGSQTGIQSGTWIRGDIGMTRASGHTGSTGQHSHAITGGGDAETVPPHVVVAYIIKAIERYDEVP